MSRAERQQAVRRAVQENIASDVRKAEEIISYSTLGGKGLRGLIAHLSLELCGAKKSTCALIAAAIEMIHAASLLHDDVIDGAGLRRHQPSANRVYGNQPAVLGGDFLYSRASQMLCRAQSLVLLTELAEATNRLAEGELLQFARTGKMIDMNCYQDVIGSKTAALFASAASTGPLLADSPTWAAPLRSYGWHLGLAFQMADDCLDYLGSPETTGKKPGVDFAEGKATLPLLCTFDQADQGERQKIAAAFAQRADEASFVWVRETVLAGRGMVRALAIVRETAGQATTALRALPAGQLRQELQDLAVKATSPCGEATTFKT